MRSYTRSNGIDADEQAFIESVIRPMDGDK